MVKGGVCALVLALAGCSYLTDSFENKPFSGDPFPIAVDTSSGAVVLGVRGDGPDDRVAVLDVLSPVTIVDPGPTAAASVSNPDLTLLGESSPGTFDVPRAHLSAPQVVSLHPCDDDAQCSVGAGLCAVGAPAAPLAYEALVGIDVFNLDALRLDLGNHQVFVFPDIAGDDTHRTLSCDAVFDAPFRGGGTLVIGGSELGFTNWRIAVQTCLAPDPREWDSAGNVVPQSARGADVLLVASTGIGVSLLGESAYARYQLVVPSAPQLAALPVDSVCLPSGVVTGHRTTIPLVALVANPPPGTTPRAPCRQVYAHHKLSVADCYPPADEPDCPCVPGDNGNADHDLFCGVPAIVELAPPGGVDILVVPDDDPTLQSLRTELRPDQPEVDGVLGASAFDALQLDVDYQHNRVLVRCNDAATCGARPQLLAPGDRRVVDDDCLSKDPGPVP